MATSGSYDFSITQADIIKRALRILNVIGQDSTPTTNQNNNAAQALNILTKELSSRPGGMLWTVEWIDLALTASTIIVGTDGNDYECILNHTSASNNKPITGSLYKSVWKATGGTGAGSAWVTATSYTSIHQIDPATNDRIVGFDVALLRNNYNDTELTSITFEEYLRFANKTSEGAPSHICLKRDINGSILYLYPRPDVSTYLISLKSYRILQDYDASTDNPDILIEWVDMIVYELSRRLMHEYDVSKQKRDEISNMADYLFTTLYGGDTESTNMTQFQPRFK